ncbi:uncharacterized protein M6B38_281810 [Iris pallida]|uniref:Uncharacterized protein n=1 Tax=Iris pallida TaxID=29817 RepID=A0AAX6I361_IRIPA|nr:uncharacterized protein M6B38_281810 [Iris pallida]
MVDTDQSEMDEATCQVVPSSDMGHPSSHINVVGLNKSVGTPCSVNGSQLLKMASVELESETWFEKVIPLSQRLLSAFITEDEVRMFDSSIKQGDAVLEVSSVSSPYATNSDARNELNPEYSADHVLKSQTNCFGEDSPCYGCATPNSFRSPNNSISCDVMLPKYDVLIQSDASDVLGLGQPNLNRSEALATDSSGTSSYECQFEHMPLDDRILMELHSIGIYPDTMPDLAEGDVEEIEKAISELKTKLYQEVQKKKSQLSKLEKAIQEGKEHERRKLEQLAMEILVETAYKRLLGGRGGSSHKSGASKVSKQLALAFAKRTLARYRVFEQTGKSCFSGPVLHDHLFAEPSHNSDEKDSNDTKFGTAANMYAELQNGPLTSRVSASGAMTSGVSSNMIERHAPRHKIERGSLVPIQGDGEQTFAKSDSVSNRGKKREVLLDEIVTNARVIPTLSDTLSGCAKWKKNDKDKDVDTLSRHSVQRAAHLSLSASRGERKTKAKPKQKINQLPTTGNGAARVTETTTFVFPSARDSCETVNTGSTKVLELELPSSRNSSQGLSKEMEDNVITNLPLQGIDTIDELDVADGLGGQGQDIASWLSVDEDALEDQDLICLQIPMDDLTELNLR